MEGMLSSSVHHLPFSIYRLHHFPFTILTMRLDQYLRASRLVLRRSVAQELCEAGAVSVGGVAARSSRTVRPGDEIAIRRGGRVITVRVNAVPSAKQVSRAEAPSLYEVISDIRLNEEV
jgi:ribosomal 50S subunit-recycling heat shock protein